MIDALVAFGSNQGDSLQFYDQAIERLVAIDGVDQFRASKAVVTSPVTGTLVASGQTSYVNGVFRFATSLDHQALLQQLLEVEQEMGRRRERRWDARTVDLDLLIYGSMVLESSNLVIPHPRMSFRRFVLEPAVEVAAEIEHPVTSCSLQSLLDCLDRPQPSFAVVTATGSMLVSKIERWIDRASHHFAKWSGEKNIFETNFFSFLDSKEAESKRDNVSEMAAPNWLAEQWQDITLLIIVAELNASDWVRVENRFRGPTLLLRPSLGWSKIETELNAALEARSC